MAADKNFRSYADVNGVTIENEYIAPPKADVYDDTLKFSNADNVVVSNCSVVGGREDCIDINRGCEGIIIEGCDLYPCGEYGMTIKGGSHDITIKDVKFFGHAHDYDIDIGNWSDQSDRRTTGVKLINVRGTTDEPVTVRVLWGDRPTIIGGNIKLTVVPQLAVVVYRFFRKFF